MVEKAQHFYLVPPDGDCVTVHKIINLSSIFSIAMHEAAINQSTAQSVVKAVNGMLYAEDACPSTVVRPVLDRKKLT